jgi:hypothetical protein
MNKLTIAAASVGALAAAALGSAGVAEAAAVTPFGGSAADTVSTLRAQGYNVQLNGFAPVSLSRCSVTGVDGLQNQPDPTRLNTVYVDFTCPDDV